MGSRVPDPSPFPDTVSLGLGTISGCSHFVLADVWCFLTPTPLSGTCAATWGPYPHQRWAISSNMRGTLWTTWPLAMGRTSGLGPSRPCLGLQCVPTQKPSLGPCPSVAMGATVRVWGMAGAIGWAAYCAPHPAHTQPQVCWALCAGEGDGSLGPVCCGQVAHPREVRCHPRGSQGPRGDPLLAANPTPSCPGDHCGACQLWVSAVRRPSHCPLVTQHVGQSCARQGHPPQQGQMPKLVWYWVHARPVPPSCLPGSVCASPAPSAPWALAHPATSRPGVPNRLRVGPWNVRESQGPELL